MESRRSERVGNRARAALCLLASLLLPAALTAGCTGHRAATPPAHDDAVRAQVQIDAGNQAYAAQDYSMAAKRYAAAAVTNPDDPAAFFGLGMALARLGRDEEARVAYAKARALARPPR